MEAMCELKKSNCKLIVTGKKSDIVMFTAVKFINYLSSTIHYNAGHKIIWFDIKPNCRIKRVLYRASMGQCMCDSVW